MKAPVNLHKAPPSNITYKPRDQLVLALISAWWRMAEVSSLTGSRPAVSPGGETSPQSIHYAAQAHSTLPAPTYPSITKCAQHERRKWLKAVPLVQGCSSHVSCLFRSPTKPACSLTMNDHLPQPTCSGSQNPFVAEQSLNTTSKVIPEIPTFPYVSIHPSVHAVLTGLPSGLHFATFYSAWAPL